MNGAKKFHKPNGPAFNVGEQWISYSGNRVTILSTRKFGEGKFDYEVSYRQLHGPNCERDAWNFQVRYNHVADKNL